MAGTEKPVSLPSKNLANMFKAAISKMNSIFNKAMFLVETNPKDPIKAAHLQLVEYFKLIQSVDISASLLKWGKEVDLESNARTKPSAFP